MKQKRIWQVYFSATGTTEKIVSRIGTGFMTLLSESGEPCHIPLKRLDFTLPQGRENPAVFSEDDLVIVGVPVYAGRVPNVLLPYLNTWKGNGAVAVPVVVFGNRNYDDALIELRDILEKDGFHTIGAAAFVGEHSFSKILGAGRPDQEDMALVDGFARRLWEKLWSEENSKAETNVQEKSDGAAVHLTEHLSDQQSKASDRRPVPVRGQVPLRPYYQPRDRKGNSINILKVKPKTREELCVRCGLCASVCPMGSISAEDVSQVTGICIKCGGCVKKCPTGAKYYDDEGYLYHKTELELGYERRAQPELFLGETADDYN